MSKIKGIFVYADYPSVALSINGIIEYLNKFGLNVSFSGNLFKSLTPTEEERGESARRISGAIVSDINTPIDNISESTQDRSILELKRLSGEENYLGVLYDGYWLQRIFHKILAEREHNDHGNGFIHIVFTGRLFGTFETKRYHARVILMGLPALISTSGIVEAPARPKDYYWLKAGFIQSGRDIGELDQFYKGKFIEYDDYRITQVLSAYALQSIVYEVSGKEFCENSACCLFNSHWQEEVLNAQLIGKLCSEHEDYIRRQFQDFN